MGARGTGASSARTQSARSGKAKAKDAGRKGARYGKAKAKGYQIQQRQRIAQALIKINANTI